MLYLELSTSCIFLAVNVKRLHNKLYIKCPYSLNIQKPLSSHKMTLMIMIFFTTQKSVFLLELQVSTSQ